MYASYSDFGDGLRVGLVVMFGVPNVFGDIS